MIINIVQIYRVRKKINKFKKIISIGENYRTEIRFAWKNCSRKQHVRLNVICSKFGSVVKQISEIFDWQKKDRRKQLKIFVL